MTAELWWRECARCELTPQRLAQQGSPLQSARGQSRKIKNLGRCSATAVSPMWPSFQHAASPRRPAATTSTKCKSFSDPDRPLAQVQVRKWMAAFNSPHHSCTTGHQTAKNRPKPIRKVTEASKAPTQGETVEPFQGCLLYPTLLLLLLCSGRTMWRGHGPILRRGGGGSPADSRFRFAGWFKAEEHAHKKGENKKTKKRATTSLFPSTHLEWT